MARGLEIMIAAFLWLISLPIQAAVALILGAQLGRPIMFRQRRAGRAGSEIIVPKYRTMTDARDASGVLLHDDLRQTRLSRLIRRLRADELPQLFTILRGRMALVGPRPLLPETIAAFGARGRLRSSVAPGLTGWAQVSGNTRLTDLEKLTLDLWYVSHRSLSLDLQILRETVGVALRGEQRREDRLQRATEWLRNAMPDSETASMDITAQPLAAGGKA